MKSFGVRLSGGTTANVRVGASFPSAKLNSNTAACPPPPTYTNLPSGEKVNPSQPSGIRVRLSSVIDDASSTLIDGGL